MIEHAHGQVRPGLDPTGRSGEERLELPEALPPGPAPGEILPPLELPPEREEKRFPAVSVVAREIRIVGSTAFTSRELSELTGPYLNREITSTDLEELRFAVTRLYIEKGYVSSGAFIPDQTVQDGVITLRVVEGELREVNVEGNTWLRSEYYQQRLFLGAEPPLNIKPLQEQLLLLNRDDRIERINADLKPGTRPGESILNVRVEERNPFRSWIEYNNYQSPSVGAEIGLITLQHKSLTGYGDILTLSYGQSSGIDDRFDVKYTFPLSPKDTTLTLRYRKNDFDVIEEPFRDLNIESKSDIYEVTFRHPVYKSLNSEVGLSLTGEHLRNRAFLLDEPFSFSPGSEDGKSTVSAFRLSQDWTYRTQSQVIAAYSRFSWGFDALDATIHEDALPDSRFFVWLGQFQWARRLEPSGIQTILRTDLQLADDSLLTLEQMAVGGRYSVRGYRENQLVRDNAFIASLEIPVPLVREKPWADVIQVIPFFDYARAWNKKLSTPSPKTIYSAGIGLRWGVTINKPFYLNPEFELFWGEALRDVETEGDDLQDDGIHFRVSLAAF